MASFSNYQVEADACKPESESIKKGDPRKISNGNDCLKKWSVGLWTIKQRLKSDPEV